MRKRMGLIVLLFVMISIFIFNCGQSIKYIAEDDEVIEWQCYGEKELFYS